MPHFLGVEESESRVSYFFVGRSVAYKRSHLIMPHIDGSGGKKEDKKRRLHSQSEQ